MTESTNLIPIVNLKSRFVDDFNPTSPTNPPPDPWQKRALLRKNKVLMVDYNIRIVQKIKILISKA